MADAPPKIVPPPTDANARWIFWILAGTGLAVAATVYFCNPRTHSFYPVCQFHRLTGLNCPGCGMTRSLYALLHGHFFAALKDNALFVLILGTLAVRSGWQSWQRRRGRSAGDFFPTLYLWPLLAVALVFTVLRNLPAFAYLSP